MSTIFKAVSLKTIKPMTPFIVLLFFMMACAMGKRSENPHEWSDDQVNEWFDEREWLGTTNLKPDPSIDKKQFATRYHQHKDRWDKAFAFLKNEDLSALAVGTRELDGKDVFAIIQEYNTKNPEDANYESHKIYTDIQCLVSGTEFIGLTDLSVTFVKTPYDEAKDIAFYDAEVGKKLLANPGTFFIFFPDNAHRPGMKVEDNVPVKKIVIKVRN